MKNSRVSLAPKCITVSILNWNESDKTERCLRAVADVVRHGGSDFVYSVHILDNASEAADWEALKVVAARTDCPAVYLRREPKNLGFAGGLNVFIESALKGAADFIWVLNDDATPEDHCMAAILQIMDTDAACGIVTPLIVPERDPEIIDFAGGVH
jgi:GT2 family glycosyltransferase